MTAVLTTFPNPSPPLLSPQSQAMTRLLGPGEDSAHEHPAHAHI